MNTGLLWKAFILIAFLATSVQLHSTHLIGGNLSYEYLGQNADGTYRYRIYTTTYTNCDDNTSNIPFPEDEIPVGIYVNDQTDPDADKVLFVEFDMPLVSSDTVSVQLDADCGIGSEVCVAQGDYEFFVDLPLNFGGYWLYYDRCCRNNEVINVELQQGVGFTTFIPSPLVENSSPFFTAAPTSFICVGDTATFLNSAIDPDGDLMLFSFIEPLVGYGDPGNPDPGPPGILDWPVPQIDYVPGYNVNQPMGAGGFAFINGATGLTQYLAPQVGQYSIAIEIKEYRNGNLIAVTRRDLQLLAIACPSQEPPALNTASQNQGTTSFTVEEGDELCIPVIFDDEEGDSLIFDSFGEVFDLNLVDPVATITEPFPTDSTIQADFCWQTSCDQGRDVPYFFGVTATDNGCPPKSGSAIYTIEVIPFTGSTDIDGETNPCESTLESYTTDLFPQGSTYQWTVTGGTIQSGQGEQTIDVEWGTSGVGTLTVIATNQRGCVGDPFDMDVAIQPLPAVDAGTDVSICLGDTIQIGGAPTGPLGSFFTWTDVDITDNTEGNPEVFPSSSTDYEVIVVSAASCTVRDTVTVIVNETALVVSEDEGICEGESTVITASGATTYNWTPNGTLSDAESPTPTATPSMTTTYVVESIDANLCEATDSVTITVSAAPMASAGLDSTHCGLGIGLEAVPTVGDGQWSSVSGAVGFSSLTDPTGSATVPTEGVYEIIWMEDNMGCVDQDTISIEFIEQPIAEITGELSICGLETNLQGGPVTGEGLWLPAAGLILSSGVDPDITATATSFGSYELIWFETNQICSDSDTIDLEFNQIPSLTIGSNDSICGDSYQLMADTDIGIGTWSSDTGVTFDDENNPNTVATAGAFGTQTIEWQVNNNGCGDTVSVDITFFEEPVANAGVDQDVCGNETELEAIVSIGDGQWTGDSGLLTIADDTDAESSLTTTTLGSFELIWTETQSICSDMDTVTINFLDEPIADAGEDVILCIGSDVQLDASGGDDYSWAPGDDLDQTDIANPTASPEETTEYIVTVALGNGCDNTDTMIVEVVPLPVVSAGEDIEYLCLGDQAQLNATPGFISYLWTPNVGLSDNTIPSPFVSPANAIETDYIITVTDANNCVNTDTINVVVNPIVPTIVGPDTTICAGASVVLGGTPTSPTGTTYVWSGPDLDDPNSSNPVAMPSETTTYSVSTSNSICNGADEITITVEEDPGLGFIFEEFPECDGVEVRFENLSPDNVDFIWDFGDGSTSALENPTHLFSYGAEYAISLNGTTLGDCEFAALDTLNVTDFLDYFQVECNNVITPNGDGMNDQLDINIRGNISECLLFEVYNRWGQKMFISTGNNTRWDGRTTSGELVAAGTYFYVIVLNGFDYKGSVTVIR